MAQVVLRCDDERHWPRAAPRLVGHLFPPLLAQSQYNTRLRQIAPLTEAAPRWLADATPATAEHPRLMDATPVPCGTSAVTAKHSGLFGHAGHGYCPSHSRLVLGRQAADHLHLRRDRHRIQPGEPQAARRAGPGPPDA